MYCYQIGQKITGDSWSEDDGVSDGGDGASSALPLSLLPGWLQPPCSPRVSWVPADHLALGGTQPAWWSQPGTFFFFPNSDSDCSRFPIGSPSDQTVAPLPVITRPRNRSACCVEDVTVFTVGERSIQAGKEEKMGVGRYYLMGWSFSWGQCLSSADDCVDGCATG